MTRRFSHKSSSQGSTQEDLLERYYRGIVNLDALVQAPRRQNRSYGAIDLAHLYGQISLNKCQIQDVFDGDRSVQFTMISLMLILQSTSSIEVSSQQCLNDCSLQLH